MIYLIIFLLRSASDEISSREEEKKKKLVHRNQGAKSGTRSSRKEASQKGRAQKEENNDSRDADAIRIKGSDSNFHIQQLDSRLR